ncbi:hypothetical protein RN001_007102 [Aquatica leii]|uniref:Cadherin domain-containing protein n=1 Tax=Aquatica leii TaxID=1421715 RepID=A0AAN7S8Z0_9COLE|nr:hypothetical protein RN001_007102 [Aquatica leii]
MAYNRLINVFILNQLENEDCDSGYPLHNKARNCIERCFGVIKSRFRCILKYRTLNYNPVKAAKIVCSCVILHNMGSRKEMQLNLTDNSVLENHQVTAQIILINDTERNTATRNVKNIQDFSKYVNSNVVASVNHFKNDQNAKSFSNQKIAFNLTFACQNNKVKELDIDKSVHGVNTSRSLVCTLPIPWLSTFYTTNFTRKINVCVMPNYTEEWCKTTDEILKCHQANKTNTNEPELTYDTHLKVIDQSNPRRVGKNGTLLSLPNFEYSHYDARYVYTNEHHYFYIYRTIKLINSSPNINIQIHDDYKTYFSVTVSSNLVYVNVIKEFSKDFLMDKLIMFVTLEAYIGNAKCIGKTVLVINIDKQFVTPSETPSLKFEKNQYWFEVTNLYDGFIGYVKAIAKPPLLVTYFIPVAGLNRPKQLTIDPFTGRLSLLSALKVGIYKIIVTASAPTSELKTYTNVVINVKKSAQLQTKNSIMVIHVTEHIETRIKLPCQYYYAVCLYEIIDQYPNTNPLLFSSNLGYLYIAPIDREMNIIINMNVPQFQIRLRLVKSTHVAVKRDAKNREWVNVPEIVTNEIDQLLLSVIIDDVNDNPPIFREGTKLVVGYYCTNFSLPLLPYITQVYAKDADSGVNADITYTIDNSNFVIHPKTGFLYLENKNFITDTPITFLITATDKNGSDTGLFSKLNITVVPLALKNLLLITSNNTLETLPFGTNLSIKTLSSISYTQNELTRSKIVLYALDEDNVPLESTELAKMINETGLPIEISTLSDGCQKNYSSCNLIRKRFIIAVSTMGMILLIFVIVAFVSSVFRCKERKNKTKRNNSNKPEASIEVSVLSDGINPDLKVDKEDN